ncbi:MliC family protein [Oceanicoccus sp. KOV_DT_Chl]|uniref:MliC family protein n=1 Tax=Oceanicoccus sp. KOV_DT_Chl TaxID=1904639 RepID=UPI000C79777B|nr:MliC family protein [Oceanicoccus sp. KOV_DT_Chl]
MPIKPRFISGKNYTGIRTVFFSLPFIVLLIACTESDKTSVSAASLCTNEWFQSVEKSVVSGDGQGHGPDVGSDEWKSVVEFKLGLRGDASLPARASSEWCSYIDQRIQSRLTSASPSFVCNGVREGSIEALVCADETLAALDRSLAQVYAAATAKAGNEQPPVLKAEQRGWIKGRNDCWKAEDKNQCITTEYQHRIAELQARYRLVASNGPYRFSCDNNPAKEVVVTYFETVPATLIAEHGDSVSLMYRQPAASGSFYQGGNESFREHQGEAQIVWGYQAPVMRCQL